MSLAALGIWLGALSLMLAWVGLAVAVSARLAARRPVVGVVLLVALLGAVLATWLWFALRAVALTRVFGLDSTLLVAVLGVGALGGVGTLLFLVRGWQRPREEDPRRAQRWSISLLLVALGLSATLGASSVVALDRQRWSELDRRRAENAARRATLIVPPLTNAGAEEVYQRAYELVGDGRARLEAIRDGLEPERATRLSYEGPLRDDELAAFGPLVDDLRPAFEAIARVREFPEARFGFDPEATEAFPALQEIARLRALSILSAMAARVAAARGDREATLAHLLVLDQIATHLVAQPSFQHLLVAFSIRSLATNVIASVAGQVDLRDPRLVDSSFDEALTARLRAALVYEQCTAESVLLEIAGRNSGALKGLDVDPAMGTWLVRPTFRLVGLRTELDALDRGVAGIAAAVDGGTAVSDDPTPTGLFTGLVMGSAGKMVEITRVSSSNSALRRLAIALRTSPESITEANLPRDPFGRSDERLRLVRDGDRVTIYGRGRNGLDEGGPDGVPSDDVPLLRLRDVGR
ncbi:MAG: hypothetical protein JNM94_00455 [Phycisphaerae bacterium]|nr:hypothetical protein [Phycisphaerae bacterium]